MEYHLNCHFEWNLLSALLSKLKVQFQAFSDADQIKMLDYTSMYITVYENISIKP